MHLICIHILKIISLHVKKSICIYLFIFYIYIKIFIYLYFFILYFIYLCIFSLSTSKCCSFLDAIIKVCSQHKSFLSGNYFVVSWFFKFILLVICVASWNGRFMSSINSSISRLISLSITLLSFSIFTLSRTTIQILNYLLFSLWN